MNTKKLLFYLLAGILGGCLPVMSLHPLYTKEDVVFDEKLVGTWVDDPKSPKTTWEFSRAGAKEKAYKLVYFDEEGKKGSFVVHLAKLENRLFLDLYPSEFPCGEMEDPNKVAWPYNMFFFVPAHMFIKINSIEPQLRMQSMDDDDFKKLLEENPNAIKHEIVKDYDGEIVLTASTKELQAFVLKYADDNRVFSEETVLSRKTAEGLDEPNDIDASEDQ
ncbi:MAG: hypothetical protein ACYS0C_10055 [Planctomycetota bacterium]|jgi:hypothetical protein